MLSVAFSLIYCVLVIDIFILKLSATVSMEISKAESKVNN